MEKLLKSLFRVPFWVYQKSFFKGQCLGAILEHDIHLWIQVPPGQKCNFWWTHFACFGPSIAAISYTISAHKVSH